MEEHKINLRKTVGLYVIVYYTNTNTNKTENDKKNPS